jgi:hypothetical protein
MSIKIYKPRNFNKKWVSFAKEVAYDYNCSVRGVTGITPEFFGKEFGDWMWRVQCDNAIRNKMTLETFYTFLDPSCDTEDRNYFRAYVLLKKFGNKGAIKQAPKWCDPMITSLVNRYPLFSNRSK